MTTFGATRPAPAAVHGTQGSARGRRKGRGVGVVLPAAAIASVTVAAVTVAAYLVSPDGGGPASLAQAIDSLPGSRPVALLEQERQEIILMNAAASTLTTAARPAVVSPAQVETATAAQQESAQSQDSATPAAPDPAAAQAIAQELMPSYGFSVSSQWTCLLDLWTQESSWEYDALNPVSGAYGIPQALPASQMASAGSDWQTDPTTQIRWGLGYIQERYGTPCDAWDHEEAYDWY